MNLPGTFKATKKDGTIYYRSSITFKNKHISLGSFPTDEEAHLAYLEAGKLTTDITITLDHFQNNISILSFEKWVIIINYRDNNIYFGTHSKSLYIYRKHNFLFFLTLLTFLVMLI